MSVLLKRFLALETVTVEPFTGVDGQGMAAYGPPVQFDVRVKRADEMAVSADGSEVRASLTIWVPAEAAVLPSERDRVTYKGETYIGVERVEVKTFSGEVSHVRLRLENE